MILLTLSRGKGEETVRLQLPASPAEIGEAFASLDRISLDTTATAILDVSSNVPVLYRCLYDVDVEDSEQFQKLQKLAERTEALSPAKAAIFSGPLFTLLQYLFLETQIFVTRLNSIYGAVAAIPLFMFWLNFGWFIILLGAELSYAFQNVNNYNIDTK